MIDSFETIEPRFFLIASLMRSLWRSWSMMPLRWSDQSLRWTDISVYLSLYDVGAAFRIIKLNTTFGESVDAGNNFYRRRTSRNSAATNRDAVRAFPSSENTRTA